jgi:S1-C subfamily serine protease
VSARASRLPWLALALAAGWGIAPPAAAGPEVGAALVEREFAAALRKVTPATVVCTPKGAHKGHPGSSGVIISKDGWVLSDGDAGLVPPPPPPRTDAPTTPTGPREGRPPLRPPERTYTDDVEIRVPDPVVPGKPPSSRTYAARVVKRFGAPLDSSLSKIVSPPLSGFPFVPLASSESLQVGAFAFAAGNAFGSSEEGTPTLTAGVVSALVRAPPGDPAGKHLEIYTSAAVNPGVNGGPLVDAEGSLIGVVSTWITPASEPGSPFQFLGKVIPIDRIRAAYKTVPEAARAFSDPKALPAKSKQSALFERAVEVAAQRAYGSVVSLEVARKTPLQLHVGPNTRLPRYAGATSGIVVTPQGHVVTALYNLANTAALAGGGVPGLLEKDLAAIVEIKAHLPDGRTAPCALLAHDQRVGIALLKAEVGAEAWKPLEVAPPEAVEVGRTVLCVANPFGGTRCPDPFLTMGIVSRLHPADAPEPWRGDFQTDAGVTDGNAGGALVDLRGRVIGIATPWQPAVHGRNSGIGFGIPWECVQRALPALEAGTSFRYGNGYLGVAWDLEDGAVTILEVVEGAPAGKAGVQKADRIVAVDGKPLKSLVDAQDAVRSHAAGEKITLTIERAGKTFDLEIVLGARPGA